MKKRDYYSQRTNAEDGRKIISLDILKRLFLIVYKKLDNEGYFQKYFGFYCIDRDDNYGELGRDIESVIYLHLLKEKIYPVALNINNYSEEDLFDMIEFLHDYCSKGLSGYYHDYGDCGFHYETFDDELGKQYFRSLVNPILKDYKDPYEISDNGEILSIGEEGLNNILTAEIQTKDENNIRSKIKLSVLKFRSYRSSISDRSDAVRELVDVLEYLRPQAKKHLDKKDESELFNIANNFGIRHHNETQKHDYDKAIWLSWMFYHYLATIHALLRIVEKNK